MVADLIHDLLGLLQGRTRRQHRLDEHDALILIGEIGGGHALEQEYQGRHDQQVDKQVAELSRQDMADHGLVPVPGPAKPPVEPSEKWPKQKEAGLRGLMPLGHRLEERGAQNRGQDQGHHHREQHGGDDGHGKLPVDDAGGAAEERHGAEHRREHQPDADQARW